MKSIQSVIMAGGTSARLWPVSQTYLPKQFIKLFNGKSLLQITLERNRGFSRPAVMVRKEHGKIAKKQIDEIGISADIIIEPYEKNTAACAIVASLYAIQKRADAVLLLPVDHLIQGRTQYIDSMSRAVAVSDNENIVTFGVKPSRAHSGYGYMKAGLELSKKLFAVRQFIEKPSIARAAEFIKSGDYYWNSGIFVFEPESLLNLATNLDPATYRASYEAFSNSEYFENFIALETEAYRSISPNSIDYAFIEKHNNISMIKADFAWRDVGCWNTMWELYDKDPDGNVIYGAVELFDTQNSYVYSDHKLTAVMGLKDVVIVNTKEAALVMHRSRSESVRKLVRYLAEKHTKQI